MRNLILFTMLIFAGVACDKPVLEESTGIVKDLTGFDGCGKVILLDNGITLEPVEVPQNITLQPNARISVKFRKIERYTACMSGLTVKVIDLRYL